MFIDSLGVAFYAYVPTQDVVFHHRRRRINCVYYLIVINEIFVLVFIMVSDNGTK